MTRSTNFEKFLDDLKVVPVLNPDTFSGLQKQAQSHPGLLQEIFDSFFEDARELSGNLETADAARDEKSYLEALHTLKGLAGTIGASRLHELTGFLYSQARNNDLSDASKALPVIKECIMELEKELQGKV